MTGLKEGVLRVEPSPDANQLALLPVKSGGIVIYDIRHLPPRVSRKRAAWGAGISQVVWSADSTQLVALDSDSVRQRVRAHGAWRMAHGACRMAHLACRMSMSHSSVDAPVLLCRECLSRWMKRDQSQVEAKVKSCTSQSLAYDIAYWPHADSPLDGLVCCTSERKPVGLAALQEADQALNAAGSERVERASRQAARGARRIVLQRRLRNTQPRRLARVSGTGRWQDQARQCL